MHYNEIYLVHAYSFCTSYLATCTACIRPKLHTFGMHWLQRWHSACHSGAAETLIAGLGFQRASSCIGSSCHLLQILRVHPLACLHIKTDDVISNSAWFQQACITRGSVRVCYMCDRDLLLSTALSHDREDCLAMRTLYMRAHRPEVRAASRSF